MFKSYIMLSKNFYDAMPRHPYVDLRTLKVLRSWT